MVASSNNGAVENVTQEIPARTAVQDWSWPDQCAYWPELGQHLLEADSTEKDARRPAWGMLAARLGNMANRGQFFGAFWFGRITRKDAPDIPGMREILQSPPPVSWPGAVDAYRTAASQSQSLRLVLGGDPRRPGAKAFATERPNLLNVAASRAERRIYVVGDRQDWASQPHFSVLARELPPATRAD